MQSETTTWDRARLHSQSYEKEADLGGMRRSNEEEEDREGEKCVPFEA